MYFIFCTIFCTVSLCLGMKILTTEGMLLEKIGVWAENKGKWVEPLVRCEWCMPSVYTLISFFLLTHIGIIYPGIWMAYSYLVIVAASSFLNGVLWNMALIVIKKSNEDK